MPRPMTTAGTKKYQSKGNLPKPITMMPIANMPPTIPAPTGMNRITPGCGPVDLEAIRLSMEQA